jgi:hypothetical protein
VPRGAALFGARRGEQRLGATVSAYLRCEPQKSEELEATQGAMTKPHAMVLGAIPVLNSCQIRAVLGPTQLVAAAERMRIRVSIQRMIAFGPAEQAQSPHPTSPPECGVERKHSTVCWPRVVHAATRIGPKKHARSRPLRERHQRARQSVSEHDQASRLAREIDLARRQPVDDLECGAPSLVDQTPEIRASQRNAQISAAVCTSRAAKFQVA